MADLRLPDINQITIAGRITRDPELKYTQSSRPYCKLGLAYSRKFKTRDGDTREEQLFIDMTVWDKQAEFLGQTLRKGRPVLVEGSLKMDTWEDRDSGQKRTKFEINPRRVHFLDWDDDGRGGGGRGYAGGQREENRQGASASQGYDEREPEGPDAEDDIPF